MNTGRTFMQDMWRPELLLGIRNEASGRWGTQSTDELFLLMTRRSGPPGHFHLMGKSWKQLNGLVFSTVS